MPIRMLATAGTVADGAQAAALIEGIPAEYLLAARGYDANRALAAARERGMVPALPPKRNRKVAREYDRVLCQARHLVERLQQIEGMARSGAALCEECGVVLGDLPDTRPGAVGQNNSVTRPRKCRQITRHSGWRRDLGQALGMMGAP